MGCTQSNSHPMTDSVNKKEKAKKDESKKKDGGEETHKKDKASKNKDEGDSK
jgi:hypothetical protein